MMLYDKVHYTLEDAEIWSVLGPQLSRVLPPFCSWIFCGGYVSTRISKIPVLVRALPVLERVHPF